MRSKRCIGTMAAWLFQCDLAIVDMLRDRHLYMSWPPGWSVKLRLTSTWSLATYHRTPLNTNFGHGQIDVNGWHRKTKTCHEKFTRSIFGDQLFSTWSVYGRNNVRALTCDSLPFIAHLMQLVNLHMIHFFCIFHPGCRPQCKEPQPTDSTSSGSRETACSSDEGMYLYYLHSGLKSFLESKSLKSFTIFCGPSDFAYL